MTEKMRHQNLADNLKRALRSASDRFDYLTNPPARTATIYDIMIVAAPGEYPRAELLASDNIVTNLSIGDVVFIPDLAQFGILFTAPDGSTGYAPATAKKFVSGITRDISNKNEAYKKIEPYHVAIISLFR